MAAGSSSRRPRKAPRLEFSDSSRDQKLNIIARSMNAFCAARPQKIFAAIHLTAAFAHYASAQLLALFAANPQTSSFD
jgi:hypothetical protein